MKKNIFILFLLSSFYSFGQSPKELFELGMTFHQSNPDKAIKYYSKTIVDDPYYVDAYFNRGLLYFQDEAYEKAQLDFENTVKISPKDAEAYENLANTTFILEDYAKAKSYYDKAISLNPYSSNLFLNRAICKSILKIPSASDDFINAIKINPQNTDALRSYGDFLFEKNDAKQALAYYDEAIKYNPTDALAYNNKGKVYLSMGLTSEALENFTKAINLDEKDQFLVNRGLLYLKMNNTSAAMADLLAAIQLNPSNISAYNSLGFLYLQEKDYKNALKYFDFALDNPNNSMDAVKGHLEACMANQLYKKAAKDCKRILKNMPNDAFAKEQLRICERKL